MGSECQFKEKIVNGTNYEWDHVRMGPCANGNDSTSVTRLISLHAQNCMKIARGAHSFPKLLVEIFTALSKSQFVAI